MYAEFWKLTAEGKVMPCVGSDSVLYLDGRWRTSTSIARARVACRNGGFYGFSLQSGPMNRPHARRIRAMEVVA